MPEVKITDRISYIPACETPLSADVGIVRGDEYIYIYDVGSTPETLDFLHSLNGKCDIVISHFHGDHTWWLTKHHRGEEGVKPDDTISLEYERPGFRRLYVGSHTKKYIPDGTAVTAPTLISSRSGLRLPADERVFDEPAGFRPTGQGQAGLGPAGHEQTGTEQTKTEQTGTEQTGTEQTGTEQTGLAPDDRTGGNGMDYSSSGIYDGVKIDIFPIPNSHCKGALMMMVDDEYAFVGDSVYSMTRNGKACYNAQLLKEEIELLESIPADKLLVSHDRKFVRNKNVVLRQLKTIYSHRTPDSPYIELK